MSDEKDQIRALMESWRAGVTGLSIELASEMIWTIVEAAVRKRGGRPRAELIEGLRKPHPNQTQTSTKPPSPVSDPISDLDLFSGIRPDLSKQSDLEKVNMMSENRQPAAAKPNVFTAALAEFCKCWERRYGVRYQPTAADRNQLGRILNGMDADALAALTGCFQRYIEDNDPWLTQTRRHSLQEFCTAGGHNKYRVEAPTMSVKESKAVAGVTSWLARKQAERTNGGGE